MASFSPSAAEILAAQQATQELLANQNNPFAASQDSSEPPQPSFEELMLAQSLSQGGDPVSIPATQSLGSIASQQQQAAPVAPKPTAIPSGSGFVDELGRPVDSTGRLTSSQFVGPSRDYGDASGGFEAQGLGWGNQGGNGNNGGFEAQGLGWGNQGGNQQQNQQYAYVPPNQSNPVQQNYALDSANRMYQNFWTQPQAMANQATQIIGDQLNANANRINSNNQLNAILATKQYGIKTLGDMLGGVLGRMGYGGVGGSSPQRLDAYGNPVSATPGQGWIPATGSGSYGPSPEDVKAGFYNPANWESGVVGQGSFGRPAPQQSQQSPFAGRYQDVNSRQFADLNGQYGSTITQRPVPRQQIRFAAQGLRNSGNGATAATGSTPVSGGQGRALNSQMADIRRGMGGQQATGLDRDMTHGYTGLQQNAQQANAQQGLGLLSAIQNRQGDVARNQMNVVSPLLRATLAYANA